MKLKKPLNRSLKIYLNKEKFNQMPITKYLSNKKGINDKTGVEKHTNGNLKALKLNIPQF